MKNRLFLDQYYSDSKSERQIFDLAFPENASGNLGLVLCIHGGGWIEGCKDQYTQVIEEVCDRKGVAAACLNYRYVSENVDFSGELDDISSALLAIKSKGAEYGVNFDKVLLTGISAGGHLSLLYAYTRRYSAPVEPVCVVELCGPADFRDPFYYSEGNMICKNTSVEYFSGIIGNGIGFRIYPDNFESALNAIDKYSPVNHVGSDSVPTFFGHGVNDEIVPYMNAVELDEKLTQYNIEHRFISFPDSGHMCEDKSSISEIMSLFFDCIERYLK